MANKVYSINPSDVRFDDTFTVFNPMHTEEEYNATKENIRRVGQLDPILMLNGVCIDGRHRTKICKELGHTVKCIDIDPELSDQEIIIMCNKNTMSGRDFDSTQKAIQALALVNKHGITITDSAIFMKIGRKHVSYASSIKGYGRQDILDALMNRENKVQLDNMSLPSRSLEVICKNLKALTEKEIVVDNSERVEWQAEGHIKTEAGKVAYYEMSNAIEMFDKVRIQMWLVELVNLKYKQVEVEPDK